MRRVTQKISAAYEVAAELCLLFQVIIYKPVPVDIASTLEVNHVKSEFCVIDSCDCVCLLLSVIHYMNFDLTVNECMYVIYQFTVA